MTAESETDGGPSLETLVTTAVVSLTMITAFGLLAAGVEWFWVVFIVGFAGVLPAASVLASWYESRSESAPSREQPLEALRTRYANGEISEAEFERQVETLLETEPESGVTQPEPGSGTDLGTLSGPEPESTSVSGLETEIDSPADSDPESLADIEAKSESLSGVNPESKSESLSAFRAAMDSEDTDPDREREREREEE